MTIWANHRNEQHPADPPVQQEPTPPNLFRMVAAANARSELSVRSELDLVKAGLLYGDKVTLLSPITTMLLRTEGLQNFTLRRLFQLFRRFAPTGLPPAELAQFERGAAFVDPLLGVFELFGLGGHQLDRAIIELLKPHYLGPLYQAVADVGTQAGIDELARARREGLVEIEDADPGDELDLLVSCLISAQLAQSGQRQENPHTDRLVETFVDRLSKHLTSGRNYLLFDEPVANLTEAAIREGLFRPATGPAGRSAQAMAVSGLLGRLPTFPSASVDEVLDIRGALAPSLTQFRSVMVTISKDFTSESWESGFEDEVHDVWVERVHPAIESIRESVRENHSLRDYVTDYGRALNKAWPGLTLIGAGVVGHADAAQVIGGVLTGALPLFQALRDRNKNQADIRMQPFYFLYKAERALGQR